MTVTSLIPEAPATPEERREYEAFYHEHKEAHVPQSRDQDIVSDEVGDVLAVHAPQLWVARDLCCYWIRGNNEVYLAPDVLAGDPPAPEAGARSYRQWDHGRLRLVLEVASESSRTHDRGPKLDRYAEGLLPDEYVYFDPADGELRLWRLAETGYEEALPDTEGRIASAAVGLRLGVEGRRLRLFDSAGGPLQTYSELAARLAEAEAELEALRGTASGSEGQP